jgi:serine protease Do
MPVKHLSKEAKMSKLLNRRSAPGAAIAALALAAVGLGTLTPSSAQDENKTKSVAYTRVEQTSKNGLWHEGGLMPEKISSPFAMLARQLKPAVVNIRVTKMVEARNPMQEFFGFGRQAPRGPRPQEGAGSGFIIHKDGFIVTNNHVIGDAEEIEVRLSNGDIYRAEVIGSDAKTDVALIQLKEGPGNLPFAPLGDSSSLEIGEWAMAIGNPYGLEHTVTVGIVSATGRSIGAGPYDDFIQTDASINPGNSGGPLFNSAGEVIGMNTAILAGGQGLGFSVPINMIKEILPQLKDKGKVTRAYLGVQVQQMTLELAKQFGLEKPRGALVAQILDDSSAEKAGVEVGDLILEFNGEPINEMRDLPFVVARSPIGKQVRMIVLRDGKRKTLQVQLKEMDDEESASSRSSRGGPATATGKLGVQVRPVEDGKGGLQVVSVQPGSPAERASLQQGDIIRKVNHKPVASTADLQRLLSRASGSILLLVERESGAAFVVVHLDK